VGSSKVALGGVVRTGPTTDNRGDDGIDDDLAHVAAILRRLAGDGLGPAMGLSVDRRKRASIERVARLGPEQLRRRLADVYAGHYSSFVDYANLLLGNRHDAEDVVCEAFARVLRADPDLEVPENLAGYVRRAVRNAAYDRSSKNTRDRHARQPNELVDLEARLVSAGQPVADRVCDDVTLAVALHVLSERQRQCFTLRFLDGFSVKDIAARLAISEGNVKRICHEVRSRLAVALDAAA
jgi:RNA polymerase sigma-70 factor (ECF subfamily)